MCIVCTVTLIFSPHLETKLSLERNNVNSLYNILVLVVCNIDMISFDFVMQEQLLPITMITITAMNHNGIIYITWTVMELKILCGTVRVTHR